MKIGRQFNTLSVKQYCFYIDNYKKYTDFNILGLYRSIIENEKLEPEEKLLIRDYAHQKFKKTFEFLQLKDPGTFYSVSTLGLVLTKADETQIWDDIRANQQKILADKRIKHRNFGDYSKHNCGYDNCPMNGLMIRQGSPIGYGEMHFDSDRSRWGAQTKSKKRRRERKNASQIIRNEVLISQ